MRKEGLEVHTTRLMVDYAKNLKRVEIRVRGECLEGVKRFSIKREKWKWNLILRLRYIQKSQLDGSRSCQDLSSTKSRQIWICQSAIKNLSTAKVPWWIEILSRIYRPDRKFLDGSRSYRNKVQKAWWIEYVIRSIEKRSPKGSIDRNLSRICWEVVELDKKEFFKERKNTKRWMQTSKLLKHRSNQHVKLSNVKLSKTSLNKNNAKHS